MVKPIIRRLDGLWYCVGRCCGKTGSTPRAAYLAWKAGWERMT